MCRALNPHCTHQTGTQTKTDKAKPGSADARFARSCYQKERIQASLLKCRALEQQLKSGDIRATQSRPHRSGGHPVAARCAALSARLIGLLGQGAVLRRAEELGEGGAVAAAHGGEQRGVRGGGWGVGLRRAASSLGGEDELTRRIVLPTDREAVGGCIAQR